MSHSASTNRSIRWKLDRLRDGKKARVVDLFAGCGGLTLGAQLAGCQPIGAIELDPPAARSYAINFHGRESQAALAMHSKPRDITRTDPLEFLREIRPESQVGSV